MCDALWDSLVGPYEIKPRVCLQRKTIWGLLLFFICFLLATSMPHWFHVSRVRKGFVVHYEVKHFTVVGFIHIESGVISTYICDSASVSFCLMEDIVVVRICSHLQSRFHVFISRSWRRVQKVSLCLVFRFHLRFRVAERVQRHHCKTFSINSS